MAEKILSNEVNKQFEQDYKRYGIYILYRRVLSDYRDGLKPVQRRIIWAMYKNTKAITSRVKSAAVVGDVMKYYHPHSDCLHGSTKIYGLDNKIYTIEELYKNNVQKLDVLSIDPNTGNVVPAIATNFRIGQWTKELYHISLTNGACIVCTSNHPFMTPKLKYIQAKDIVKGTKLLSYDRIFKSNYPAAVKSIDITNISEEIPMYDFTVDGTENMLIPVDIHANEFISVHNSAIYGTIKPLANWFETNIPLIDGGGNFGTFQGDKEAASRYTECRLSKFAIENVLGEIMDSPEAVDWSPTYNEATVEPDYLPVKVPLLLINGSFGIGLGLRAEIPSHNINEVIDATLALMDNPNARICLIPDHCMPCEIFNTDFEKICNLGFGHYRVRGKIDIEQYKGRTALIIKSCPNLTFLDGIVDKIEDLIKKKKLIQIENMFDESTVDNMRYVILLKPGSDPNYVKDVIYKNTSLEQVNRINLETLDGLKPLRMSYRSYLLSFIDFRKLTKFRVYTNMLQAVQTKIHEREAYIRVLESGEIDNIINIIKKQKTVDDNSLIEYLIKKLNITDLQAQYIINSDLKKLSYGYLEKYKAEAKEFEIERQNIMSHAMNEKMIENDIREELLAIKAKYGKPRTCPIISANTDSDIPKGEMILGITDKNFVMKVPSGSNLPTSKNGLIKKIIMIDNTDSLLIFDEVGKVFKLPVHKIPFSDKSSGGTDIRFLIRSLTANVTTIIPESVVKNFAGKGTYNNKHYLITLTNSGLIKRMDLDDFITVPPSGILYAKVDKGDFVKDIVIAHSNFNTVIYSDRKAIVINVNDIPYLKRNTKGSKAMSNVDYVDGICVIYNGCTDIVVITESGRMNRISVLGGLSNTTRGKSGSNLIKLSSGDKIVSVVSGNENDLIHVNSVGGKEIIKIADLELGSSISAGNKVIQTRGNKILNCTVEIGAAK